MKFGISIARLSFTIVAFLFLVSFGLQAQNLRVLTFNIWDPNDIPFGEKYANGFPVDKVVKYISEDNADILLLQEVSLENPPHRSGS